MKHLPYRLTSYLVTFLITLTPVAAQAQDAPERPQGSSAVLLTEIQTGAVSASDEFIELYNTGSVAVDITNWQVRYLNATATNSETTLLATVTSTAGGRIILPAQAYFVFHTASVQPLETVMGQIYNAKLSSADKAIGLFAPVTDQCQLVIQDAVGWGTSTAGEGSAVPSITTGDKLLQRYRYSHGGYIDTDSNLHDWGIGSTAKSTAAVATDGSPGGANVTLPLVPLAGTSGQSLMSAVAMADCTLPPVDEPAGGVEQPVDDTPATDPSGSDSSDPTANSSESNTPSTPSGNAYLQTPQISELLPNPGSPRTDAQDEFIELYNPDTQSFDLSGCILQVGSRRYVFPDGTSLSAGAFGAFFAADTHLSLPNDGGQAALLDPYGTLLSQSDAYTTAKDDQAWALVGGRWQWTVQPTPNAANVLVQPVTTASKTKAASTAKTSSKASATAKAVKGASTTKAKAKTAAKAKTTATTMPAATARPASLHTGVLALVALFAVLYGAYEYRTDLANRIYQLRRYRAARRATRTQAKGR